MKTLLLNMLVATLLATAASAGPTGSVPIGEGWDAPSIGEGHALALTPEQKIGESAAAQRRHDSVIVAGIEAALDRGQTRLAPLLRRLRAEGTAAEKALYSGSTDKTFIFPQRLQEAAQTARFQVAFDRGIDCRAKRCIQYGTEEVCNNRRICRVACWAAGGAIGGGSGTAVGGAIGGAAGQVCSEVCEMVPECRTVTFCAQYEFSGPGCF